MAAGEHVASLKESHVGWAKRSVPTVDLSAWARREERGFAHPTTSSRDHTLPRRQADCAIEPDHLAIEIAVLDDVLDEVGILIGSAEHFRKRDRGGERILHLLRHSGHHPRL